MRRKMKREITRREEEHRIAVASPIMMAALLVVLFAL
jgi:hypothetical protein